MSAIKLALQQNQKRDRRKTPEAKSAEVSPDSKCPICLDVFNNIAYLDICLHKFCFRCIHEWSKNKAECPLCKQPFNSIYHSIKSEHDFKQYYLKPVTNGSFGMFGGVRFRYRTTLTGVHRQRWGRTSPPPDNGVIFESTANPPQQRQTRYIRRMMMRMAAKRRAASEGRTFHSVRELEMVNFRRELYRQGLRVRAVRDGGRSRDTSAEFYRKNPACLHRLIPWLKRELVVLYGAHGSLVNIVQHIIMSRITRVDMEDRAIQEELWPFLQGRTEHFLHEFISFAKSPFNMEAYDQHATYEASPHSSNSDISSNSSVIAISEDEHVDVDLDPPRTPGYATSNLSHSLWDDETPGPSYSTTAEENRAGRESVRDSDSDSSVEEEAQEIKASPPHGSATRIQVDDCLSSESDDCVIVGFVKPSAERTPELVQLSSDECWSDDAKEVPPLPQHVGSDSDHPTPSPRREPGSPDRRHYLDTKERHDTLKSKVYKPSSGFERKDRGDRGKRGSKDKKHRRKRSSAERRRYSISPVNCRIRERDYYYSNSADWNHDSKYKRTASDFYHQVSRKHSDRRSRSRSCSRESRRRERRRSRSRTCSGSPSTRRTNHEKPGGKRKYKTQHLENPSSPKYPTAETKPEDGKEERSPSARGRRHKKKKKKHKKKSRRHRSAEKHSPITIGSDSDHADDTPAGTSSREPSPIKNDSF
ncbi:topoisomerase I binding, arginine/serine-rich a [Syngnathoides biaculeatus]|uniref:topoisomerase I binding, arginine/serine-rich a n=1 Tax=Syngnathoides biaculeatus TaxID=300417 RepID=UPI002ADDD63E|nr:topoisomerase I binding, arginine/serine-rich a [Syngnathoides biaculeatus]XP_061685547.1 topoisomerase I binding, arginine/serine-rich a [Syngnathoides biaculeatus]